ncbi:TerC family protein [Acidibrevibacterium fodinaquatile]|uniref:TerC family protein n=1 Tax=Acidibrevibacterium fodinaquatile TaxID=1969806 RepID=UPI000E0DA8E2|nr:hypothetical protein [Acidibrevibacterium fodinaquatile]
MSGGLLPAIIAKPVAIFFVDVLVAGDNALVIALLTRGLPARRFGQITVLATLAAVALRLALIAGAGALLAWPGMKLIGAVVLGAIALSLGANARPPVLAPRAGREGMVAMALLLAFADVALSLDNVLALAVIAGGSAVYLAIGLFGSIFALMLGSAWLSRLMAAEPWLVRLGITLLAAIAGRMAVSDPLLQPWIAGEAPALALVIPLLAAGYVFLVAAPARAPMPPAPLRHWQPAPAKARRARPARPRSFVLGHELTLFLALFSVAGLLLLGLVFLAGPPIQ